MNWTPAGTLPSRNMVSSLVISSKLVAFLIMSCNRFFSFSVSLILDILLDSPDEPLDKVASNVLDLIPIIFVASEILEARSGNRRITYTGSQSRRGISTAKELRRLLSLCIFDLLVIEKPHRMTSP